jgi:hypothetical protein
MKWIFRSLAMVASVLMALATLTMASSAAERTPTAASVSELQSPDSTLSCPHPAYYENYVRPPGSFVPQTKGAGPGGYYGVRSGTDLSCAWNGQVPGGYPVDIWCRNVGPGGSSWIFIEVSSNVRGWVPDAILIWPGNIPPCTP